MSSGSHILTQIRAQNGAEFVPNYVPKSPCRSSYPHPTRWIPKDQNEAESPGTGRLRTNSFGTPLIVTGATSPSGLQSSQPQSTIQYNVVERKEELCPCGCSDLTTNIPSCLDLEKFVSVYYSSIKHNISRLGSNGIHGKIIGQLQREIEKLHLLCQEQLMSLDLITVRVNYKVQIQVQLCGTASAASSPNQSPTS